MRLIDVARIVRTRLAEHGELIGHRHHVPTQPLAGCDRTRDLGRLLLLHQRHHRRNVACSVPQDAPRARPGVGGGTQLVLVPVGPGVPLHVSLDGAPPQGRVTLDWVLALSWLAPAVFSRSLNCPAPTMTAVASIAEVAAGS